MRHTHEQVFSNGKLCQRKNSLNSMLLYGNIKMEEMKSVTCAIQFYLFEMCSEDKMCSEVSLTFHT